MGVIGDISNLIVQGYRIWQERRAGKTVTPQMMFEKYIAPSYQLLKQIHSDYLDLYLELDERISREDPLSRETVQWFARARARRQVDRSELRLMDIAQLASHRQRSTEINDAGLEYLEKVKAYFNPVEIRESASRKRLQQKTPSASSFTAARLHVLQYWLRLSPSSQRTFAVEEFLESTSSPLQEIVVEKLLEAAADILDDEADKHLRHVAQEAGVAFDNLDEGMQDAIKQGRFEWVIKDFHWRDIIEQHIRSQLSAFRSAMGDVQKAYFNFRILSNCE